MLPHPSTISEEHVGRAMLSVIATGGADDAADRLLLSPVATLRHRPPAVCVLSRHSNAASSTQFVAAVWSCLARLRNASRDGWVAWRGAGETEIECIRQLASDKQEALAVIAHQQQQRQQPTMAALCRPLLIEAWIDTLRQLLRVTLINTGCTNTQTDSIIQSYAGIAHSSHAEQPHCVYSMGSSYRLSHSARPPTDSTAACVWFALCAPVVSGLVAHLYSTPCNGRHSQQPTRSIHTVNPLKCWSIARDVLPPYPPLWTHALSCWRVIHSLPRGRLVLLYVRPSPEASATLSVGRRVCMRLAHMCCEDS